MVIKKILETKQGELYFVKDETKDFHTKYGVIKADLIRNAKDGETIFSDHHEECTVYSPSFIDNYKKLKRLAQIPLLKDIGYVIAELGLGRNSVVADAGAGSGGVTCFLANIVKKVYSFDIEDEHIKIVTENIKELNLDNIELKKQSIYEPLSIKEIDVFFVDVPEPWKAIENVEKTLKIGGYLVSYSPNLSQVSEFSNALAQNKHFAIIKTVEIIEQKWDVEGRKIKPYSEKQHSGFLTIARKIRL